MAWRAFRLPTITFTDMLSDKCPFTPCCSFDRLSLPHYLRATALVSKLSGKAIAFLLVSRGHAPHRRFLYHSVEDTIVLKTFLFYCQRWGSKPRPRACSLAKQSTFDRHLQSYHSICIVIRCLSDFILTLLSGDV